MYVQMYTTLERQLCRYFINVKQFLIFYMYICIHMNLHVLNIHAYDKNVR